MSFWLIKSLLVSRIIIPAPVTRARKTRTLTKNRFKNLIMVVNDLNQQVFQTMIFECSERITQIRNLCLIPAQLQGEPDPA